MKRYFKRDRFLREGVVSFLVLVFVLAAAAAVFSLPLEANKNVIVMVYDGQSTGAITLTRWYKKYKGLGDHLAMDRMRVSLCSTFMEGGIITDSAAAATAFATGFKTKKDCIAVDSNGAPLATILEKAINQGASNNRYRGVNDNIFDKVFRGVYEEDIREFDPKVIRDEYSDELKKEKKRYKRLLRKYNWLKGYHAEGGGEVPDPFPMRKCLSLNRLSSWRRK